jgi:hypothetical protein
VLQPGLQFSSAASAIRAAVRCPDGSLVNQFTPKWWRTKPGESTKQLVCTTRPPDDVQNCLARAILTGRQTSATGWPHWTPKPIEKPPRHHLPRCHPAYAGSEMHCGLQRRRFNANTTTSCTPSAAGLLLNCSPRPPPRTSCKPCVVSAFQYCAARQCFYRDTRLGELMPGPSHHGTQP